MLEVSEVRMPDMSSDKAGEKPVLADKLKVSYATFIGVG